MLLLNIPQSAASLALKGLSLPLGDNASAGTSNSLTVIGLVLSYCSPVPEFQL